MMTRSEHNNRGTGHYLMNIIRAIYYTYCQRTNTDKMQTNPVKNL